MTINKYELTPIYDRAQSFYNKAVVTVYPDGTKTLTSYTTEVAEIDPAGNFHRLWDGYSATTMRHVNEFLRQNGISNGGKTFWDGCPVERAKSWVAKTFMEVA